MRTYAGQVFFLQGEITQTQEFTLKAANLSGSLYVIEFC